MLRSLLSIPGGDIVCRHSHTAFLQQSHPCKELLSTWEKEAFYPFPFALAEGIPIFLLLFFRRDPDMLPIGRLGAGGFRFSKRTSSTWTP